MITKLILINNYFRLRSCEAAYNLLKNYHKSKEVDDNWLDETYGKLNSMQPIKERAKEFLEPTRVCIKNYFILEKSITTLIAHDIMTNDSQKLNNGFLFKLT